jgi:hypothetical protein
MLAGPNPHGSAPSILICSRLGVSSCAQNQPTSSMPGPGILSIDEAGRQVGHRQATGFIARGARRARRTTVTHAITGPRSLRVGLADPSNAVTLNALRSSHRLSRGKPPSSGRPSLGALPFTDLRGEELRPTQRRSRPLVPTRTGRRRAANPCCGGLPPAEGGALTGGIGFNTSVFPYSLCVAPLSSGNGSSLVKGFLVGQQVRPQPPAGQIVPVVVPRRPAIREADFVASTLRYGFVLDDLDDPP